MIYIFFDIDGVLTDGTKYYNDDGIPFAKTFYDKDFTALKIAVSCGIKIVAVSGDERVNKNLMENRNIDFLSARSVSKWGIVSSSYSFEAEDIIVAVGDDIFDIDLLENASIAFCPKNSHPIVLDLMGKLKNGRVLNSNSGSGVMVEIVHNLINEFKLNINYKLLYSLDRVERF